MSVNNNNVYVSAINFDEKTARDWFQPHGVIESIKVYPKCAFVNMQTSEQATKAISALQGKKWNDVAVKIDHAYATRTIRPSYICSISRRRSRSRSRDARVRKSSKSTSRSPRLHRRPTNSRDHYHRSQESREDQTIQTNQTHLTNNRDEGRQEGYQAQQAHQAHQAHQSQQQIQEVQSVPEGCNNQHMAKPSVVWLPTSSTYIPAGCTTAVQQTSNEQVWQGHHNEWCRLVHCMRSTIRAEILAELQHTVNQPGF